MAELTNKPGITASLPISPPLTPANPTKLAWLWWRFKNSPLAQRLARGAFWSMAAAVMGRVVSLVSGIYIAHFLGKENFGQLGVIQSSMAMFAIFGGAGLGATSAKFVSEFRESDPAKAGRIMGLAWMLTVVTGLVSALALYFSAHWLADGSLRKPELGGALEISAVMLFFLALNGAQTGVLQGLEAFGSTAIVGTLTAVVITLLTLVGGLLGGVNGCVWGMAAGQAITWGIYHVVFRKLTRKAGLHMSLRNCWSEFHVLYRFSLPVLICDVMIVPTTWICNAILVNQPNGYAEMGLFNLGNQWRMATLFLPTTLCATLMPIMSNLHGSGRAASYRKVVLLQLLLTGGGGLLIGAGIAACSPLIVASYGRDYRGAEPVMISLVASAVLIAINNVIATDLTSRGRVWLGTLFCALVSTAMISLTVWLVPIWGARGLALAVLLAYVLHTAWQGTYLFFSLRQLSASPALGEV